MQSDGSGYHVAKTNHEIVENRSPISYGHGPFFGDVHGRQIEDFHQSVVGNEGTLRLCHLAQLTVEILNSIRGVDERPDLRRVLEHGGKLRLVDPPAFDPKDVFFASFGLRFVQCCPGSSVTAL